MCVGVCVPLYTHISISPRSQDLFMERAVKFCRAAAYGEYVGSDEAAFPARRSSDFGVKGLGLDSNPASNFRMIIKLFASFTS